MTVLDEWSFSDSSTEEKDIIVNGNRFLIGNGYLGYRGTVEEADVSYMPATIINGIYDQVESKWREPVNFPNSIMFRLYSENGMLLDIKKDFLVFHRQTLNFRYGIFSRHSIWNVNNVNVEVETERFTSMKFKNRIYIKYRIKTDGPIVLYLEKGIDGNVYDINGPHLIDFTKKEKNNFCLLSCFTQEKRIPIAVYFTDYSDSVTFIESNNIKKMGDNCISSKVVMLNFKEKGEFVFLREAVICVGNDQTKEIFPNNDWLERGPLLYNYYLEEHKKIWDNIWKDGDVIIEGDEKSQFSLRYSLYHLQIIAPRHSHDSSIPARGLSGQTYKGAVFWDTEIFIAPYFMSTDPAVVKSFIHYRIKTLDGARRKAKEYGYYGAFYAWESQESGDDACSLFNVIDVFTGRPIRTYFRDKQIHINGDIVYAIKKYIDVTGDWLILKEGAMEVVLECALFYLSYLYYSPLKSRYEILDVTGPDEYHERVNNNVFTNKLVYFTFEVALDFCTFLKEKDESFLMSLFEKTKIAQYLPLLQEVKENLYIPSPNDYGVIEQFDGYFKLEDIPICELRKRVIDPKEYWGGPNGIASFTQVIKQADVITMLYLFKEDYSCYVKKANLQYYEPRTEHGSSLSASMHALLFCDIGETEKALLYFKKTAEIDLTGDSKQFAGLVYIGGTHPAANGGTWLSVVYGFCGFSVKDGKIHLKPCLPNHWKKIVFTTYLHGEKYTISVTSEGYSICSN